MSLGCAPNSILLLFTRSRYCGCPHKVHTGCIQLGCTSCSSFGPDAAKSLVSPEFWSTKQEYAIWNAAFVYNCAIHWNIGQKHAGVHAGKSNQMQ